MTIILSYICFKLSWSATAISLIVSYYYYYSTPNRGAEYCKKHVCVFVCSQSYLQNYASNLCWIFVHVTYGRGSVLLWRCNDTLRISGFVDDVIFAHKPRLLDVATRLRQWGSHAALGLVVTFFNHNFVNCKATCTLIWRLKIYEKYNISLNDVHT